ncbi:type II toxin-antitoxin system PemK/MazF family toxin [uncultured Lamprocystis sp.]|jgi:mRNA interferase MazF|uniref:type II toxin-antitoxin system PemK/MazF family toxin n=1 Tax=uncultured Lamprocystis sp. TaxID=543132 RepID=UPI0025CC3487|nr:type II toxin-antitoxin system PemK/MazF family toxin [uncultured Lamprocystis sp.]
MNRGDILYADLSPTVGSEINKRRPVLIVSNNANNRAASTVTVLPITSNLTRVYPFEVALSSADSGLPKDSKAQAQQIRTIAKERIAGTALGRLAADKLREVDAAIRLHLAL